MSNGLSSLGEVDHEAFEHSHQAEQDAKLLVKFHYKTVPDPEATRTQGRACFKEREYIDIRVPGTRGTGASRPATARDRVRFKRHHDAFKARVELPFEGTALSEWPLISRSMATELSFVNVKTVEQLAAVSDGVASQLMGGVTFKAKAQKWLAQAEAGVTVDKLEAALALRDAQIAALSAKVEALTADKPKRKRRSKEEIDRDNNERDSGERPAEQGSSGSWPDPSS